MKIFTKLFKMFLFVIIAPLLVTTIFLFYYQNHAKEDLIQNYLDITEISSSYLRENLKNLTFRLSFINNLETLSQTDNAGFTFLLSQKLKDNPDFMFFSFLDKEGNEITHVATKELDNIETINLPYKQMVQELNKRHY